MDSDTTQPDNICLNLDSDTPAQIDPGASMDSDDDFFDDTGLILDTDTADNNDPSLNMDTVTDYTRSDQFDNDDNESSISRHCINCGSDVTGRRSHVLILENVRILIQQWIAPQVILSDSVICHSCWTLALRFTAQDVQPSTSSGHHRQLCVKCRRSLLRLRSHLLHMDSEREAQIRNFIMTRILPHELRESDRICHPCWQQAHRAVTALPRPVTEDTITLPHLKRAPDTQGHCIFPHCDSPERLSVPMWLKVKLFTEHDYYVPQNCRMCSFHIQNDFWHILSTIEEPIHSFTAAHVEDFATFVKVRNPPLDFFNIDSIPDDSFYFYIGMSKAQFNTLLEIPRLAMLKKGKLALAAYLIKLRTGNSDERISSLLNITRISLWRLMNNVRIILKEEFVPNNLGINNLPHSEIASHNLLIPNSLFGGGAERKPIVILDGTYLYVQKSSNYMYQKQTYSLHKYRNLMKPLLIVCSDGYIVDVLGPYPATMSDATIIINEFNEEASRLRQYFEPNDVFILDRGFRDCVPLLEECNYSVHMPASLPQGATQLSTLAANKSRTVTMVRWVVETVNGIFKNSFKLFRGEFFNRASNHAMTDFLIAAALINKVHKRYVDRDDAGDILMQVEQNMYRNNTLAEFVNENNLNRRRAQFSNIDVNVDSISFPRLSLNELILISCGTYQIKQARSYYAEHVRGDGSYTIEVCRERASDLLNGYPSANNYSLLRGKIQSRHITRKVYMVYILYDANVNARESIKEYYCTCIVGRRTVGCCAHIMSIIWYLSWARYQDNVTRPAQFLDNVLLTYESE